MSRPACDEFEDDIVNVTKNETVSEVLAKVAALSLCDGERPRVFHRNVKISVRGRSACAVATAALAASIGRTGADSPHHLFGHFAGLKNENFKNVVTGAGTTSGTHGSGTFLTITTPRDDAVCGHLFDLIAFSFSARAEVEVFDRAMPEFETWVGPAATLAHCDSWTGL